LIRCPSSSFLNHDFRPAIKWFAFADQERFLADPFVAVRDGRIYVLCEEFSYESFKGRIVSCEVSQDYSVSLPEVVIDLPFHVSYPFLLMYDDDFYCVPETFRANEISLYKADDFPRSWRKVRTLVKGFAGVDGTIFKYDRYWWLICTDRRTGANDKLYAWYADDLFGSWRSHRGNPVKVDERSTRPAGTPFEYEGEVFRPSQDCSKGYGRRVIINRITKLTPSEFREEAAGVISPEGPYAEGVHTVSSTDNITLVDGKRFKFVGSEFKRLLKRRLMPTRTSEDQFYLWL